MSMHLVIRKWPGVDNYNVMIVEVHQGQEQTLLFTEGISCYQVAKIKRALCSKAFSGDSLILDDNTYPYPKPSKPRSVHVEPIQQRLFTEQR